MTHPPATARRSVLLAPCQPSIRWAHWLAWQSRAKLRWSALAAFVRVTACTARFAVPRTSDGSMSAAIRNGVKRRWRPLGQRLFAGRARENRQGPLPIGDGPRRKSDGAREYRRARIAPMARPLMRADVSAHNNSAHRWTPVLLMTTSVGSTAKTRRATPPVLVFGAWNGREELTPYLGGPTGQDGGDTRSSGPRLKWVGCS
jgi:hypothetical protein